MRNIAATVGSDLLGVKRPGVKVLPIGTERYVVPGRSGRVLTFKQGDKITLIDQEGGQRCELIVINSEGKIDLGILGKKGTGTASGLMNLLKDSSFALPRGMTPSSFQNLESIDLFGTESKAGDKAFFTADESGTCFIIVPGGIMTPDQQNTATPITVLLERQKSDVAESEVALPDPLAEPRLDFRIARCTAEAYEVKAGEWIQVIDVQGRQCTDFQAFSLSQLDKGLERCLDVTTTRSLIGLGYPHPGLRAKYYDQDFEPLLEIYQDTCSRHDAFGLACFDKYYEDMGYPGHLNCSDNFNGALETYAIQPRRGWMAINFFYNTGVDDQNLFYLDEPWSRPGDFVLLKALKDLVCVSSACPDDIDAANGWNPTDIHIRTYTDDNFFKRSIGFRTRTDSDVAMTKETGFHSRTSELTRDFVEYNGYWLPNSYVNFGSTNEYMACREKAVVIDLSPLRKFEVLGPGAEELLQYCLTRNVRKMSVGQIAYSAMCYETGTMIDDGTVFRLGQDNFRWIGGCDFGGEWLRQQAEKLNLEVWVRSSTDQLHNISIQGPESREILKNVIWTPPLQPSLEELKLFRFTVGRMCSPEGESIVLSRTGYTGELGYEVFCHPKDAPEIWDKIWEVGSEYGLKPLGLEALDMLRIEAGLIFAGYEFDDQIDPFEAGISFTVPLKSKEDNFVGKAALRKRKDNPQRVLVGLELDGNEVAAHGDCVHVGRQQVVVITSATRSPILRKNIALCRMSVTHAEPGTLVEVGKLDGQQKRLSAVVVNYPFYDPEKKRVKA